MEFYSNENYKNAVRCTTEELDELKSKGWTVDMHTPGYANFIGVETGDIAIGFYCWMDNLGYDISGLACDGETTAESNLVIKSQEDLDDFCAMIQLVVKLKK